MFRIMLFAHGNEPVTVQGGFTSKKVARSWLRGVAKKLYDPADHSYKQSGEDAILVKQGKGRNAQVIATVGVELEAATWRD